MALDTFLLYLATWTLVALSPGPAVLFSMSQAARHGMRGAAAGTAGILLGHVVCVFWRRGIRPRGVAREFQRRGDGDPHRRRALSHVPRREACCFRSRAAPRPCRLRRRAGTRWPDRCRVCGVQLTNPKHLLFVLALLPQFISPDYPLLLQLAIMLVVTVVIDGIALLAYAHDRGARRACAQGLARVGVARARVRRRADLFRPEARSRR